MERQRPSQLERSQWLTNSGVLTRRLFQRSVAVSTYRPIAQQHGKADGFSGLDRLSGDYVTRILEDREGIIWVATFDGLDRFRAYAVPTISTILGSDKGTKEPVGKPQLSIACREIERRQR